MTMARRYNGAAVRRLIVSVPVAEVDAVDELIRWKHPARGNRAEFVRLAVAEKLARDKGNASTAEPVKQWPEMAERLDELADICARWARNRRSNREPATVKAAILQCVKELAEEAG